MRTIESAFDLRSSSAQPEPVSLWLAQVDLLLFHEAALLAIRKPDISTLYKPDILILPRQSVPFRSRSVPLR
jgi:hypothetical protein